MLGPVLGLLLAAIGALLGTPGLVVVGVLLSMVGVLRTLWSQRGLERVSYERRLGSERAMWGEKIGLEVTVRNRKLLPVPSLTWSATCSREPAHRSSTTIRRCTGSCRASCRCTWPPDRA